MVVSRAMQGMETAEGNRRPRSGRRVVADVQRPASATALPGGGVLVDFGRDAFGWAEVAAPAVEPHCGSLEVAGVVPTVRGPIAVGNRDARLTKGSGARR